MNISKRALDMSASPIRRLMQYANMAKKQGKTVYHLNIGQPDIATPEQFYEAIHEQHDKVLAYAPSEGDEVLIKSIVNYYNKLGYGIEKKMVRITYGGSEAVSIAVAVVCDAGDEVLTIEPFYANYVTFATAANANLLGIPTSLKNGYRLPSFEEMEKYISPRTKALIINNPSNPTGIVLTREELTNIAKLVKKYDLAMICDEVYREFCYDGEFHSFTEFPEIKKNIIYVDSVSKRFSACGARVGCLISADMKFLEQVDKFCQARLCCPTLEMRASAKLFEVGPEYFIANLNEYRKRRDTLVRELKKIRGVTCYVPQGAFYLVVGLPVEDAEAFCIWMLKNFAVDGETMMFAPGNGFYTNPRIGKNEARLAYVLGTDKLVKAVKILGLALKEYAKLYPYK